MNFVKAVKEANKGKRIRLSDWDEGEGYLIKEGMYLVWNETRARYTPVIFSILRDDWEVVK